MYDFETHIHLNNGHVIKIKGDQIPHIIERINNRDEQVSNVSRAFLMLRDQRPHKHEFTAMCRYASIVYVELVEVTDAN